MNVKTQKTLADLLADRRRDCGVKQVDGTDGSTSWQCERCGLGWRLDAVGPPCFPVVTFDEMGRAQTRARDDLLRMQRNGAVLSLYQLQDMAAYAATLRLLDLVTGDAVIMKRVAEVGRAARARGAEIAQAEQAAAVDEVAAK